MVLLAALLLGAVGVAIVAYRTTQPALGPGPRLLLTTLRTLVFALIVLMLAEPILHDRSVRTVPPGILLLVDDSASMDIRGEGEVSRREQAAAIRERIEDLVPADRANLWIGQGSRRLDESVPRNAAGELRPGRSPEGTDLPGLLVSAAQRHLEDNLRAILLVSDGVNTADRLPSLGGLGVPVSCIAVGDSIGPADLRLDRVRYPTLAYRGETLRVDAEVVAQTPSAGEGWVILESPAGADSLRVRWPEGGGRVPVAFEVPADSLGLRVRELRVEPLPGEPLVANNQTLVGFEVRKDRLRIAYVEGRPTWNFHFLHRLAASDPRFEFVGLHRGAAGWKVAGSDSTWALPRDARDTQDVDLWIAGSLEDLNSLTVTNDVLGDAVRAGAGLLVLAGEPRRGSTPSPTARAADLLPLTPAPASRWGLGRHGLRPTAAGAGHPVMDLPTDLGPPREALSALPPLWGVLTSGAPRVDADVLLETTRDGQRHPLLSLRDAGSGRVALWSGGPLWSWSFWRLGSSESEEVFRALVGNLLYFLAEGGDRTRLRLVLPQQVVAQGQDTLVRGLALDRRLQPDMVHDVWLEWAPGAAARTDSTHQPTGRARMQVDPEVPGSRRLPLPALPPGEYVVRLALEDGEERVVSEWKDLVVDPYSVEFQHPRVDRASLQRIAETTGGAVVDRAGLASWARDLDLVARETVVTARIDLWGSLWLFLPLLGLLSTEWALRKRWGLI